MTARRRIRVWLGDSQDVYEDTATDHYFTEFENGVLRIKKWSDNDVHYGYAFFGVMKYQLVAAYSVGSWLRINVESITQSTYQRESA